MNSLLQICNVGKNSSHCYDFDVLEPNRFFEMLCGEFLVKNSKIFLSSKPQRLVSGNSPACSDDQPVEPTDW